MKTNEIKVYTMTTKKTPKKKDRFRLIILALRLFFKRTCQCIAITRVTINVKTITNKQDKTYQQLKKQHKC